MNKQLIVRNAGVQTVYQIVSNILGFVFTVVLIKATSQFEFGVYSYIFSTLVIVNLFIELGIPTYFLRHWSTNPEDFEKERQLLLGTRILLTIPVSILLFIYVFFIDRFVSLEFLLAYVYFLLDGYLQLNKMFLSARDRFHLTALIDGTEKAIAYGGGIAVLLLGGKLLMVFVLFIIGKLIAIALSNVWTGGFKPPKFDVQKSIEVVKKSLPLFMLSVFGILYFRVDMLIIRHLLGVAAVAPYSTAYRLMDAAVILPGIILAVSVPTLTKLYADKEDGKLTRSLFLATRYLSVVAFYIAACCLLFAKEVMLTAFGTDYQSAAPVLQIFGLTIIVLYLNAPLSYFMYTGRKEKIHTKVLAFLTILNIGLNLIFIPILGVVGAALATLLCELIGFFFLRHFVGHSLPLNAIVAPALCIMISALVALLLKPNWIIAAFFMGLIYLLLLFVTQTISFKELSFRTK